MLRNIYRIPEPLAEFIGLVEDLEPFFVRLGFTVEGGETCERFRFQAV